MSETSPKNLSRPCSNTFLVSQASHRLYFAFFVLNQRCLAMFAGSGMVSSCKLSGGTQPLVISNND